MARQQCNRQWVYFIGAEAEAVKIGIASHLDKRLSGVQCGNHLRLRLLAAFETTLARDVETNFHMVFHAHRLVGEWFRPNPALTECIERLLKLDAAYLAEFHGTGRIRTPDGYARTEMPWDLDRGPSEETFGAIMEGARLQMEAVNKRFGITAATQPLSCKPTRLGLRS